MEEDIKQLERLRKLFYDDYDFIKNEIVVELTCSEMTAIENLINKNKELETMVEIMSKTMHYICLFSSQSKYLIAKYCKIYNSENIGECEGSICSECVANYFRKKAKGE